MKQTNEPIAVALPLAASYDDCRISACLKRLFVSTKIKAEPGFVVKDSVADVKREIELLNRDKITELTYDYLVTMEQSLPGTQFRYVVIYRGSKPTLFAYFQLFTLTSRNFSLDKNKGFVKHILHFFLDLKKVKVLISGNALRTGTASFCFDSSQLDVSEAIELVASAAEKIAADEHTSALIVKDIPSVTGTTKWFTKAGFEMPWKDMVMVMDVNSEWQNIEDYIACLSRKYKTRAKKILTAGNGITVKQLSEEDIQKYSGNIARLFKNVTDSQSFVLTNPDGNHFQALKELYKDSFEVTGFFKDDKLVAFFSAFIMQDAYEIYYVGFDYDLNNEYQLYFNLLFSGLDRVIQLGKSRLKLGRTSFDAKASLGAKPQELYYFYKPGNISKIVSKWFANYFSAMEDAKWKLRNPFKEAVKL